jgi:hypothetical protein
MWPWYLYGDDVTRQSKFCAFGTETYCDTGLWIWRSQHRDSRFHPRICFTSLRIPTRSTSYISQLVTKLDIEEGGDMFRSDVRLCIGIQQQCLICLRLLLRISFEAYAKRCRPPLWSGGQSSWLRIQRFGFNSRGYRIFWEVVGLERGPLSLVSATDPLCGLVVRVPGYESRGSGSIPGATKFSEK